MCKGPEAKKILEDGPCAGRLLQWQIVCSLQTVKNFGFYPKCKRHSLYSWKQGDAVI